ncbi:hypothetical protein [Enhygromyxa salina]|uniref:Uncharacterized protein n=1 Tax=Enhygromyxa salina TaxID=215803 RepID=A0A2S9Y2G8_9BACT|nr:hypothetical protein [Enhygromyxa salina]PRP99285.1 hypothetical protein ENSA7_63270 [Enhygromyxa salina]
MRKLALTFVGLTAFTFGLTLEGCKQECVVGAEGCECTGGGACDPGLTCLSMICVNAGPNPDEQSDNTSGNTNPGDGDSGDGDTGDGDSGDGDPGDGDGDSGDGDPGDGDGDSGDGDGDGDGGPKLDVLPPDEGNDGMPCELGCQKIDMLFALDGSASMIQEINALKSGQAFLSIVDTLEGLNCGGIDYRIGVTADNDNGWLVPNGWADPNPWFDSLEYAPNEISVHFEAAATKAGNSGGAPLGCEHVLSSAVNLLDGDSSGFVRDDALLVVVLLSDVDDYGWYDQQGGNLCGIGCNVGGQAVATLQSTLVALKGGDPAGVSAIVIAGDPMMNAGDNFCGQPRSCGAPVEAYHAERLFEFAMLQEGMNGYAADVCDGPAAVPEAVEAALVDNIDLACQEYQPEG